MDFGCFTRTQVRLAWYLDYPFFHVTLDIRRVVSGEVLVGTEIPGGGRRRGGREGRRGGGGGGGNIPNAAMSPPE